AARGGNGVRRVLPVFRWTAARARDGDHRDHPAGRVGPGSRDSRSRRRRRRGDGVHKPPAFQALNGSEGLVRLPGDPPSPWEGPYGFSRVIAVGGFVLVGGTTSVGPDGVVRGGTPYEQTLEILRKIEHELSRLDARMSDVIQTRMYVTDISRSEEVGRAHGEVFNETRPLMTMVGISGLVHPRM